MKHAQNVVVGDVLVVASEHGAVMPTTVTRVAESLQFGLYNPYTKVRALIFGLSQTLKPKP